MSNSIVQAVLFRKVDWNLQNSMKWLENNHFKAKKEDITNNWFRYISLEPIDLKNKGYTHHANKFIEDESIILVIAYK
jgi:hypothetical protein